MGPLLTTIGNGTTQVLEALTLMIASIAPVSVSTTQPKAVTAKPEDLDSRTLADIGVERGSITWMR